MFIAAGVSYAIVAGTFSILLPEAIAAIQAGGAAAISNALIAFGPLFFAVIVFLASIYAYEMKVEMPLAFEQFRGIGGRLPIPFLYVSVLPVILASSLELSLTVWFRFIAGVQGTFQNLARFIAYYQPVASTTGATSLQLTGGHHIPDFADIPASLFGILRRDRRLRHVFHILHHAHNPALPSVGRGDSRAGMDTRHSLHAGAGRALRHIRQVLDRAYRPEPEERGRAARHLRLADTGVQEGSEDSRERAQQVHTNAHDTGKHIRRASGGAGHAHRGYRAREWGYSLP